MKIISISNDIYNKLEKFSLSKEISNSEAELYHFIYNNERKILKTLDTIDNHNYINKIYTIETLNENKNYLSDSFCVPDYLCECDGKIFAFTTPYIKGANLDGILNSNQFSYQEQLFYLKQIGEILNELKQIRQNTPLKDIYLNDLHASNFIVHNYKLKVVDLDSCKIGNNQTFASKYLNPFCLASNIDKYKVNKENSNGYLIADENTDLYCYIMVLLKYIFGKSINICIEKEFSRYLNYLEYVGFDKELLEILSKIATNEDNINPKDYIDTITGKQLKKARIYFK